MDLSAQVKEKGAVGDLLDLDTVQLRTGGRDRVRMGRVGREHRHVANLHLFLDAYQVDRIQQPTGVGDRTRQLGEGARPVLESYSQGEAERS